MGVTYRRGKNIEEEGYLGGDEGSKVRNPIEP